MVVSIISHLLSGMILHVQQPMKIPSLQPKMDTQESQYKMG